MAPDRKTSVTVSSSVLLRLKEHRENEFEPLWHVIGRLLDEHDQAFPDRGERAEA